MSLRLIAQEEIPVAFFMFDGTSPFTDHSGRGKTAVVPSITNLVLNPSIEVNTTSWSASSNSSISRVNTQFYSGGWSLLLNRTNTTAGNCYTQTPVATVVGKQYTVAARIYAVKAGIKLHAGFGGPTSAVITSLNSWTEQRITFTATATSTAIFVSDDSAGTWVVGPCAYIDSVMVVEGADSTIPFFDDNAGATWTGTANNSTSNISASLSGKPINLLKNPSAETGTTWLGVSRITITSSDEWASSGTKSFKCVRTADASPDAFLDMNVSNLVSDGRLKPSTVYTMMGTVKQTALISGVDEGSTVGMGQRKSLFVHLNGTGIGIVNGTNSIGVETLRYTFTTPSSLAGYNSIRFYTGGAVGDVFYWDSLALIEGTYSGPYFDGDSPGALWTGTEHSSTSIQYSASGYHSALVKDAHRALLIGDSNRVTVDAPVYRQGFEHLPFSVELAVRSIKKDPTNLSPQQIFGNSGEMDGITIAGTVVSFSTKYTTTGEAKCSFDMQENKAAFIDAIHTLAKNQLYIDGDLVAEVDITAEQQADTYLSAGTTMSMGETTSGNLLAVNGLSIYRNEISEEAIFQHYSEANDNLSEASVATAFKGANLDLSPEQSNPYLIQTYTSESDWNRGIMSFTTTEYGQLVPQVREGESVAGTWTAIQPLPQEEGTLYGVTLNWQGEGATVQTSTDNATWTTVKRGTRTGTIPSGFNPVNKFLYVRVSFPGGIVNDESYIDELAIAIYTTATLPPFDGRTVTLVSTSIENGSDVLEYNENYGAEVAAGSITIGAMGANSMLPKTIEIWSKKTSTVTTFTDNLFSASPTVQYTNGGSKQNYQVDEWQLRTYVFDDGYSGDIVLSGTGQIGTITMYPYAMSDTEVYQSYKSYTGIPNIVVQETSNIGIEDIPDYVDIYGYDWSIESAG